MKKLKKVVSYLLLLTLAVSLSMCTNTEKGAKKDVKNLKSKTEKELKTEKIAVDTLSANTKQYFDNKVALSKAQLFVTEAKTDLVIHKDNLKAKKDLDKALQVLSTVKKSDDNTFNTSVDKIKASVNNAKSDVDTDVNKARLELDNIDGSIKNELTSWDTETHNEKSKIANDYNRHYAELMAKTYLLKARLASDKTATYSQAEKYLNESDKKYAEAENYGNAKYKATIEELRKDIKEADASLKSNNKKAKSKIDAIIKKLAKYSTYKDDSYYYIPVV